MFSGEKNNPSPYFPIYLLQKRVCLSYHIRTRHKLCKETAPECYYTNSFGAFRKRND